MPSDSEHALPQPFNVSDFEDTEKAFRHLSMSQLLQTYALFQSMGFRPVVKLGPKVVEKGLKWGLPIRYVLKKTLYRQFCGGETLEECVRVCDALKDSGVEAILDYAIEGALDIEGIELEQVADEVVAALDFTKERMRLPFGVFKLSGLAPTFLLQKISLGGALSASETDFWQRCLDQVERICRHAHAQSVRLFFDAEESWIQPCIDDLCRQAMRRYNKEQAIIFNTMQMYRVDRLEALRNELELAKAGGYHLGIKLVRGAYLEKEQRYATEHGLSSAVFSDKRDTDLSYNQAQRLLLDNLSHAAFCSATHNEQSCAELVNAVRDLKLSPGDPRISTSQLYGMGNHLSYTLADLGFHASKYVPYGPLEAALPYLFRRAEENSSIQGQSAREYLLLKKELKRRRSR